MEGECFLLNPGCYVSLAAGRGVGRKQEKRAEEEKKRKEEGDGEGMGTVDPDWGNQSSVHEDEQ